MTLTTLANRTDPTRTQTLRRQFERAMGRRFGRVVSLIRQAVVDEDVLALDRPAANQEMTLPEVRFDFPQSERKVRGFMQWLNRQVRAGVLEAEVVDGEMVATGPEPWTNTYIRSSYQKGIERARVEAKKADPSIFTRAQLGTDQQAISAAFNQPFHADRVGLLYSRAFEELHGVTEAMGQQIRRTLAEGIAQGINPRQMATRLNNRVRRVGLTRARTIARTETIRAHHAATIREYEAAGVEGVEVKAEWLTAGDDRVCEECASLEGRVFALDEIEGLIPRHPNCFPGFVKVSAPDAIAASKRWFDGELVIIRTATGKEFTSTPNHPVLTGRGWVAAGDVQQPDYLVSGLLGDSGTAVGGHDQHVPTPIEEVAHAIGRAPEVSAREVPTTAPHFHGDGMDGDVAVVWANGKLWREGEAAINQHPAKLSLGFRNMMSRALAGLRAPAQFIEGPLHAADRLMSGFDLTALLRLAHLTPLQRLSLGLAANANARFDEPAANDDPVKSVPFRHSILAHARSVVGDDRRIVSRDAVARGPVATPRFEDATDHLVGDAEPLGERAARGSLKVHGDDVVSVIRKKWSGHVYNLQTRRGWFEAEGIVTHNCRCVALPAESETDE